MARLAPLAAGLLAGAAGTCALNVVTYGDMAVRGRPASTVPGESVARIAQSLGTTLDGNRREAFGALVGYADGFTFGTLYGALRPYLRDVPWPLAGSVLGLATILAEFVAARLGATDPRTWGLSGWLETLVPRLAYGLCAAATYERLAPR